MYYIGFCLLEQFYVDQVQKMATSSQPLMITFQKQVLDSCPLARAKGVLPGSAVSVAKAILGPQSCGLSWNQQDYIEGQERWLHVCEKYTDAIEPIHQHSAYLDLSAHAQPEDIAAILTRDLQANGFQAKIGIGGNKWIAEMTATHGDPGHIALIMPRKYVGGFPVSLLPCQPSHIKKLTLLGCHRIGDILSIPSQALRAQFGEDATVLRKLALGGDDPYVRAIYPKDTISAVFWPSSPIETTLHLESCLEVVSQRIGDKLEKADKLGHGIGLYLEREDKPPLQRKRTFVKPIFDAITAIHALRSMTVLLHEPVIAIRAQIIDLKPRQRHQPSLDGPNDSAAKKQKAEQAIQSVQKLFGETAVQPTSAMVTPRQLYLRAFHDEHKP